MEKPIRPQRNRRHSRRAWPPEDDLHQPRLVKRLFTPEIKRMLKDWLIRRRENPYPSRDEKKRLAYETGLTYTQICNWFANWRRKLKNSERQRQRERSRKSWGHLIKNYNSNARGNVEQFSISSEDSIWAEDEHLQASEDGSRDGPSSGTECELNPAGGQLGNFEMLVKPHMYYADSSSPRIDELNGQFFTHFSFNGDTVRSEAEHAHQINLPDIVYSGNKAKYKQKIMEKYLREEHTGVKQMQEQHVTSGNVNVLGGETELSKWLHSAAKFTPDKNNYYIEWKGKRSKLEKKGCFVPLQRSLTTSTTQPRQDFNSLHHKDELDAAEALANLAFNCRQRMLDTSAVSVGGIQPSINAIPSS